MSLLGSLKKAAKKALGVNGGKKKVKLAGSMGPSAGASSSRAASSAQRASRSARGRDSTILTPGSSVNSRSLLG